MDPRSGTGRLGGLGNRSHILRSCRIADSIPVAARRRDTPHHRGFVTEVVYVKNKAGRVGEGGALPCMGHICSRQFLGKLLPVYAQEKAILFLV